MREKRNEKNYKNRLERNRKCAENKSISKIHQLPVIKN